MKLLKLLNRVAILVAASTSAHAQGTAFTYQGRLIDGSNPATGIYDLMFTLYDSPNTGVIVAGPFVKSPVAITNGLFTATMDFGNGVFDGSARWVGIAVRRGGSSGPFIELLGRQPITSTPYAITAGNLTGVVPSAGLAGTYSSAVTFNNPTSSFSGNGAELTSLNASNLVGTIATAGKVANSATTATSVNTPNTIVARDGAGNFSAGTITAQAFGGNWQVVTGDITGEPNRAYLVKGSGPITVTLPGSPAVGDTVRISGAGIGGWKLAQNAGNRIDTWNVGFSGTFWNARARTDFWSGVASSADGTKLVAMVSGGYIYTSTDSGVTWIEQCPPPPEGAAGCGAYVWSGVASSADGTKLVAVVGRPGEFSLKGQIYTSPDSGVRWFPRDSARTWSGVASSADGTKLVAVAYTIGIYTSTDSGAHWTARGNNRNWYGVASSADGAKLVAVAASEALGNPGGIFTSTNSGVTWIQREMGRSWRSVASSADGTRLAAVVAGGQIYTSTDSGESWITRESNRAWQCIASSVDGTRLTAVVDGGQVYSSIDAGVNWTSREANRSWRGVASSADGTKLVAVVDGGQIYTCTTPTTTTIGTEGYLTGDHYSALELLYTGNGAWLPLSYIGNLTAY